MTRKSHKICAQDMWSLNHILGHFCCEILSVDSLSHIHLWEKLFQYVRPLDFVRHWKWTAKYQIWRAMNYWCLLNAKPLTNALMILHRIKIASWSVVLLLINRIIDFWGGYVRDPILFEFHFRHWTSFMLCFDYATSLEVVYYGLNYSVLIRSMNGECVFYVYSDSQRIWISLSLKLLNRQRTSISHCARQSSFKIWQGKHTSIGWEPYLEKWSFVQFLGQIRYSHLTLIISSEFRLAVLNMFQV